MENKAFCYCSISSGVGIGVVDVGYERRLANHLGAHRTPSILGIINGKVTFFHYAVAKEHLRQFVEGLLPLRLVEQVHRFAAGMAALQMLIKNIYKNTRKHPGWWMKLAPFLFQITDKNYQQLLNSWHELNKPHVFLFDQVPGVPLLYKVGNFPEIFTLETADN